MITNKVRKIMSEATNRFAKTEEVNPNEITIVIHTKNEGLLPEYYYLINNKPKMEDGEIIDLDFKKDILGKKIDIMNVEGLAAQFLSQRFDFFNKLYEEMDVFDMDLMIKPKDQQASEFFVLLFNKKKFVKQYTLDEIFEIG